jgi:hypothetical protein
MCCTQREAIDCSQPVVWAEAQQNGRRVTWLGWHLLMDVLLVGRVNVTLLKHEPMFVYHMPDTMIELQSTFERLFHEERTYVNISDILNGTAEELIPSKHKDLTCAHLLSPDASFPSRRRVQPQHRRGGSIILGPCLDRRP